MNTEHYRHMLLAKEKELVATLAQTAGQARQATEPDVQDEMDLVVRSEEKEALLRENSSEFDLLARVRAALRRVEDGTYGKCLFCGRPIGEKRLNALPWAEFDVQHQAEEDRAAARPDGGATL